MTNSILAFIFGSSDIIFSCYYLIFGKSYIRVVALDTMHTLQLEYMSGSCVISLVFRFNISKNGARAGAVVFSDRLPYTKVHSRLTDHESNDAFKTSILAAPHMGYRTRIDLALEKARDDIFDPANGKLRS